MSESGESVLVVFSESAHVPIKLSTARALFAEAEQAGQLVTVVAAPVESRKIMAKRRHDLKAALRTLAFSVKALKEGWIAGAALDTFIQEPMAAEHPFRTTPNLLIAPHQASFARETGERVSNAAAQAIVDLMQGRRPQLLVNPDVLSSPAARVKVG